jgi:multidrug efflux pump subunit AcrB
MLLFSPRLSPIDVSNALGNQNLILPAGDAKIGDKDYQVKVNSSPRILAEMNNMPIKVVNGATVYLGDVARCATATPCRPASCAPTAPAARCSPSCATGRLPRWRW